jgi:hypothetical protein
VACCIHTKLDVKVLDALRNNNPRRGALPARRRGPYHARHSSVTWQLMLGKNLLWVAKQHGHSVEVMLRMYAAWLEGATESDIHAIKQAVEGRPYARASIPDARAAISALNSAKNHVNRS